MTTISIIGTGNMGQAIAAVARRGGADVQALGRADSAVPATGDIVVLAVPHTAVSEVLEQRREQLAGKIVVDITNPVDFSTMDDLAVDADASKADEITRELPTATVLKAFNTNFASTLAAGTVGPLPTTVLIAGDDEAAKRTLSALLSSAGLRGIDAGSLKRARELEALGFLQITLAAREKFGWTDGFGVVA